MDTTEQKMDCSFIGRLNNVSPIEGDRYYLRVLLKNVRAPTSYEFLRTFNGVMYETNRDAALERRLLLSDTHIIDSMREVATYQMPHTLRQLFATILIYNSPSDPKSLWEDFKMPLSEDIIQNQPGDLEDSFQKSLQKIDTFMKTMGRTVSEFGLQQLRKYRTPSSTYETDIHAEQAVEVSENDLQSVQQLNSKQKQAFDEIVTAMLSENGGYFFIDGPGGTGKTFLYRALLATVRATRGIALAVASSGVAASLLPGGRTAHSRFKLPIQIEESMTCSLSKQSAQ